MNANDRHWLLRGIVADHGELYATNLHFHTAIDILVTMIPSMVDGLAASAVESQKAHDEAVAHLMSMPIGSVSGVAPDGSSL